jgi:branched-subunit amino acid transport protein AzlD
MGVVILFCRAVPFLFFPGGDKSSPRVKAFLGFVERTVPRVVMTILAFTAIGSGFLGETSTSPEGEVSGFLNDGILVLAASVFTALLHLWKRNSLVSIFGGTAVYMILQRIVQGNFLS